MADATGMRQKTSFSFEIYYPAHSGTTQAERDEVMGSLGLSLQQLLVAHDSAATVVVSDSHNGPNHKIVELITTLQDPQIAEILEGFGLRHGVSVTALE